MGSYNLFLHKKTPWLTLFGMRHGVLVRAQIALRARGC